MFETDVERILDDLVPVGRQLGIRCDSATVDVVRLVLEPSKPAWNHLGTVYVGAIFTLAELTAGALAAIGSREVAIPVLVASNLEFVRPADGPMACVSVPPHRDLFSDLPEMLRRDRRTSTTFEARCDVDGRAVACVQFTYRWLAGDQLVAAG